MLLTDPFGHPSPTDGSNELSLDITKQSNAVDRPIWSPSPTDGSNGLSLDITKQSNAVDRSIWSPSPTDGSRPATANCLEVIRQRQQAAGISGEASQLLAAGWNKGTNTTYQNTWKQWDSWHSKQQVDPVSCPV